MTAQPYHETPIALPTRRRRGGRGVRVARLVLATPLLFAALALVVLHADVRALEARIAAQWMSWTLPEAATSFGDVFYVHLAHDHVVAFQVTAECTSVILIAPLLAFAAVVLGATRVDVIRPFLAVAAMVVLTTVVNQLRLGVIVWMTTGLGLGVGYDLGHRLVGSVIGIAGFVAAVTVMLMIMGMRRAGARGESSGEAPS
ncbi:hypothetical protein [Microbacterium sp. NPDC089695]|uniref:hypothetical protein n=1 Tax=Microbacterium sp. NPDC089695 TaxID=3364198 RepID=UPI0037F7B518